MKHVEVRVPHALEPNEVKRRIDAGLVRAKNEFADSLGDVEATWQDEQRLELTLAVMGVSIDGDVEVLTDEVVVRVELPAMAMLFAGRIRQGIETRLGGLLGSSQG